MSYLCIENENEVPVEAFTMLGVSSSRGNAESIGQFGTGSKHGVLSLLRAEIEAYYYSGTTKITPYTEEQYVDNVGCISRVNYKIGTRTEKTSMTLSFGELDWSESIPMALREFISNALDAVDGDWRQISISTVEKPRGKAGKTRVFVAMNREVGKYLSEMKDRFLHCTGKQGLRILPKQELSKCRVYRKGVFVRELPRNSIFDYNFGEELEIDESRNLNDYAAESAITHAVKRDVEACKKIISTLTSGQTDCIEAGFSSWRLEGSTAILEAWNSLYDENQVLCSSIVDAQYVEKKGLPYVVIHSGQWFEALRAMGVRNSLNVLSTLEQKGGEIHDASEECISTVHSVWNMLEELEYTFGKPIPEIKQFSSAMDAGVKCYGYRQGDAIYLADEMCTNKRVILEEIAHYISDCSDETRDFEDWIFALCDKFMSLVL